MECMKMKNGGNMPGGEQVAGEVQSTGGFENVPFAV